MQLWPWVGIWFFCRYQKSKRVVGGTSHILRSGPPLGGKAGDAIKIVPLKRAVLQSGNLGCRRCWCHDIFIEVRKCHVCVFKIQRDHLYFVNETRNERCCELNTIFATYFDAILTCYQVLSNITNTCKPSTPFPALWHTTQWSISSAERKSSRSEYNFRFRSSVAVAVQSHSNVVSVGWKSCVGQAKSGDFPIFGR